MKVRRIFFVCSLLMLAVVSAAADKRFTLVIDAGHGGHDAGALGKFSKEKNINLKVALAFGRLVESNLPQVKVVYTRKTDVFVPLHERANIANRNKADLFVSIHTNALPKGKQGRGLETYTLGMDRAGENFDVAKRENSVILVEKDYQQHYEGFDPRSSESYIMFEFLQDQNMAQSVELARLVQSKTCAAAARQNKGVKQAGFLVLRETSMPSCLIELGFITTPSEEQYLNSANGVNALGKGIYQAFAEYWRKHDKNARKVPVVMNSRTETARTKPGGRGKQPDKEASRPRGKSVGETPDASGDNPSLTGRSLTSEQTAQSPSEKTAQSPSEQDSVLTEGETPAVEPETVEGGQGASSGVQTVGQELQEPPVFKVQILASSRRLSPDNAQLKGAVELDCYEENGMFKYTCGASSDYNEIYRLRKSLLNRFPQAFIIAFKNGGKVNVAEAIREFRQNRKINSK